MGRSISPSISTGGKPPALVSADDELASYLVGARKSIKEGNYDRAIEVLQALIDKSDSGFVSDADGRRYVALWHRANEALATMGPDGMKLYRRLYDPQAEKLFEQAASGQDMSALRRLTQQFLHTAYGGKALCRLGDIHFDRGHFACAAMYWRRASRLKAVSSEMPMLLAKIASTLHLAGDASGSQGASDELRKSHKGASGVMSGKKQDLALFVDQVRKIPVPDIAARRHQAGEKWSGLGAFPDGLAVMGDCDVVLTPSWRAPGDVPIGPVNIRGKMIAMQSLLTNYRGGYTMTPKPRKGHVYVNYASTRGNSSGVNATGFFMPPGIQPVVAGNLVLCRLDDGVSAYDINTGADIEGKPIWSTRFSPMYRNGSGSGMQSYSGVMQKISDNGHYAMTVDGDRLYLLAKFTPAQQPHSSRGMSPQAHANTSVLQSLSISRNGRLMWQSDDNSVNSDEAVLGGKFISVPTVHNGRLYSLVAFREMYHLVCMAAETGKVIWRVAISQIPAMAQNYRVYNQHLLDRGSPVAIAEGMAFVATNAGVVAAFEAESGAAVWAYQYDSDINKAMSNLYGSIIQLTGQPSVNPIIVTRGKVVALPIDSKKILMFSTLDGKPTGLWNDRRGHSDLSAIDADRVLLSGPGMIVLSTVTGKEIHKTADMQIVGRPAVSAGGVLASGQGSLIRLDLKDYSHSTQVFTNSNCLLGNLVCVGGKLIAANSAGVCVYLSYADSVASLTKRIERQKGLARLNLIFDRGQLSFNSRKFDSALADFKVTCDAARKGGYTAIDAQVTRWLYRTHVAMGNASGTPDEMRKHFELAQTAARTLGDSGAQSVLRCTMRLARVMELRAIEHQTAAAEKLASGDKDAAANLEGKRHAVLTEAVKLARGIAETYPDKRVPDIRIGAEADNSVRDTEETMLMPAGVWAQSKFIPRIIRDHGRKCYASFDDQAGQMLKQAIVNNDSDAMLEVAKRWPNSLWAAQAMYEAGTSLYVRTRDSGSQEDDPAMSKAAWLMAGAAATDDSMLAVASLAGRATIHHRMGMTTYAKSICRDMRKLCLAKGITLSETIEFAGTESRIIEFLRKFEGSKPLPLEAGGAPESLAAPLSEAFAIKGEDIFIVRDQEYRPIRQGANVLLLIDGKAVWCDTTAKSAKDAILWQSGAPVAPMDQLRSYMTAPGHGLIAGSSSDVRTVVLADRGSCGATGFDIATGKVRWRGTFAEWGITSVAYMSAGDGMLVLTDSSGKVVCVGLNDGNIRWVNKLVGGSRAPVAPPRIARGVVMVKSNAYKMLTCFDAMGGRVLWKWAGSSSAEGRMTDEGLILVMVDGVVSLHDPARMNRSLWARKYDVSAKPILLTSDGGRLFISEGVHSPWIDVVSMSGGVRLTRVKAENFTGSKTTSVTGAVARSGDLYVTFGGLVSGNRNSHFGRQTMIKGLGVQKIDLDDGRVVWRNELGATNYYFYTLPIIVTDAAVVTACKDTQQTIPRKIHLLDTEQGRDIQDIEVYKGLTGVMKQGDRVRLGSMLQPVLVNGRLLVETFGGVSIYKQK